MWERSMNMKTRMHLVAISIGLLISVTAVGQTRKGPVGVEGEFKALIDQYYAAWSTLNPDNAAKLYAKDADLVFYDIAPLKYNNWAEYKEGVKKAFTETMSSGKLTPKDDLKVTQRGNVVWTTV